MEIQNSKASYSAKARDRKKINIFNRKREGE
jgi:hypothetical protein